VGTQPLTIYGDLSDLAQEANIMYFWQDFVGADVGMTYAIFIFSTAGWNIDELTTLVLSWEVSVNGPSAIPGRDQDQFVKVFIKYQDSTWVQIDSVNASDFSSIDRAYGWGDYTIPTPFEDYIINDQIQLRFEYQTQLSAPADWDHLIYFWTLVLEYQQNAAVTTLPPKQITILSPNTTTTGGLFALYTAEGYYYEITKSIIPGSSGTLQFVVEYDLSHYGVESLLGIRFEHLDFFFVGVQFGQIFIVGESSNLFLSYLRDDMDYPNPNIIPDDRRGTFFTLGDFDVNQSIHLLYEIQYDNYEYPLLKVGIDLAQISVVRDASPIIISDLQDPIIYAGNYLQLNITCLDGRAPITQIAVEPWGDFIGMVEGFYTYSRLMPTAGDRNISIIVEDAAGQVYNHSAGILTVLPRPIAISLYLAENAQEQKFSIYFTMMDLFSGSPLALFPFTKTILKDGVFFRQQDHQTTPTGAFYLEEGIIDYLDQNYTVIISTSETPLYEATQVQASIILSDTTPFITIDDVIFTSPLKASTLITVDYTTASQGVLDTLWLYRNFTPYLQITPAVLGAQSFSFSDVSGLWEYYLYAISSRGQEGYSPPFSLNISALDTEIFCDSMLDMESYVISLDIDLRDELDRSCVDVPLQVIIYDFGEVFYDRSLMTGVGGVMLLIHFDPYLDHTFTIKITSAATPLYDGDTLFTESELAFEGYPLYSVLLIAVSAGVVGVTLNVLRRRLRTRPVVGGNRNV